MAISGSIRSTANHGGWLEWLTRIGFASKGLVYFLMGLLALMAAFGAGGETATQKEVLRRIADQPFGTVAVAIIAAGLIAYAAWRIISSVYDTDGEGSDKKGKAKRFGHFLVGLLYATVAVYAVKLLTGNGGGGSEEGSADAWTATLMSMPFGVFLVVVAGLLAIAIGIAQIRTGWKEKFMRKMRTSEMSSMERGAVCQAGTWGFAARGVVFSIIGVFLIVAAAQHNPSRARGLEGALNALASQPLGQFLLGLVAIGLMAYGVYSVMASKYRMVKT